MVKFVATRFALIFTALMLIAGLGITSLLAAAPVYAATYYVDNDRPDNTGNGLTPATAWKTLTWAVANANAGGTIIVLPGLYDNPNNGEIFPITITKSLTITSSGGAAATVIDADDTGHVVHMDLDDGEAVTFTGFTVTNGDEDGIHVDDDDGGGFLNNIIQAVQKVRWRGRW